MDFAAKHAFEFDIMATMNSTASERLTAAFLENRERLARLASRRLSPLLATRFASDDILQETFIAAQSRLLFFESRPDVPVYFKFRTILLQVLAEIERRHLGVRKRDAAQEIRLDEMSYDGKDAGIEEIPSKAPSPATRLARKERNALLRHVLGELAANDRQILILRHFDGLSNHECAAVLSIDPKAASIRYARALVRLRERLADYSEFKP